MKSDKNRAENSQKLEKLCNETSFDSDKNDPDEQNKHAHVNPINTSYNMCKCIHF